MGQGGKDKIEPSGLAADPRIDRPAVSGLHLHHGGRLVGLAESRCMMAVKRKKRQPRIRHTLKQKAELVRDANPILRTLTAGLGKSLYESGVLELSENGIVLKVEGELKSYELAKQHTESQQMQYLALVYMQTILINYGSKETFHEVWGFLAGFCTVVSTAVPELNKQQEVIELLTKHRAAGGRATRKLTPELEAIARELIKAEMGPRISLTTACARAAPKLKKLHHVDVSPRTLSKLIPANSSETAERFHD